ncbi:pseudouridine synthase [Paracoccus thiocyanatus]|uniref:Pseudouridine synthase n=1 Tax=Paracoccus thiocyanatus TaxID=34006 RepID=A0A3D8PAL0_9RHOB|nr:pseudouridine synthase [Paracoccus thiocyanatus]RDW12209.1 RNA pseudouridine synthase [Paracoccus thiocyanatus]
MTDTPPDSPQANPQPAPQADRIAKVMARAGIASRRDAERMILEGRVTVNGQKIASPALDVTPADRISVDGKPLEEPQQTRLWLYYKPLGLVTSNSDEKGRQTVFDALPRDLPRVMTVGRLDLNSEGLLLLTNDGELKRRLELPTTGWLRRYRVRVNGQPNDLSFAPLRRGVTIEGEEFAPMEISLDSQQGANAWLTVGIREGRNREIRRAMAHIGLMVNRLIRVGYGPFKLTGLEENEVREVKRKVLRDQLGGLLTGETEEKPRSFRERGAAHAEEGEARPRRPRGEGDRKPFARREDGERKPFARREEGDRKPFAKRPDGDRKPFAKREDGERKPFARREDGERKPFAKRPDGERKPFAKRDDSERKPFARRDDTRSGGERGERSGKPNFRAGEEGRGFKPRADGGFKPRGEGKPARDFKSGKPGGKSGPKPGFAKPQRAPGKGTRPEGKGPRRG